MKKSVFIGLMCCLATIGMVTISWAAEQEEQKLPSNSDQSQEIRASHILVATGKLDEKGKANAKVKVEELLRQIRNGGSFEELAKTYSDCPSKTNGGDLGYFKRGKMVKEFEDAAFALDIGEISDVVETVYGYHIIQVTDRRKLLETKLPKSKEKTPREYVSPWGITFVIEGVAGTSDQLLRVKGTKLSARATTPMLLVNSKFPAMHITKDLADNHSKANLSDGELWASFPPSSDRLFLAYETKGEINWFGYDLSGKIVLLSSLEPNGKFIKKWHLNAGGRGANLQGLKPVDVQGWTELILSGAAEYRPNSSEIVNDFNFDRKLILHTGESQESGKNFFVHVWEGTTYTGSDGIPTGRAYRYRIKGYLTAKPTTDTDNPFVSAHSGDGEIVALTIKKIEQTHQTTDLPSEWAICEGEFTFSMVELPNGGLAFNPWGELSRGNGRLVWKDKNEALHTFEFSDVDMCSVPGHSGWDSVKPCINVSESERIVLLDADPNNLRDRYKGPIMVLPR